MHMAFSFPHIFIGLLFFLGGLRTILTDTDKLVVAVGGFTALALGIYTTRFDFSVTVEFLFIVSKLGDTYMIHASHKIYTAE